MIGCGVLLGDLVVQLFDPFLNDLQGNHFTLKAKIFLADAVGNSPGKCLQRVTRASSEPQVKVALSVSLVEAVGVQGLVATKRRIFPFKHA